MRGDQLARVERLREVVVGAHLEADDAVDVLALRVSMMIGTSSPAPRRRRHTASPSSPGSIRSSTTRLGGSRCRRLSSSRASGIARTSKPWPDR
jgi:hypothetical protein